MPYNRYHNNDTLDQHESQRLNQIISHCKICHNEFNNSERINLCGGCFSYLPQLIADILLHRGHKRMTYYNGVGSEYSPLTDYPNEDNDVLSCLSEYSKDCYKDEESRNKIKEIYRKELGVDPNTVDCHRHY